MKQPWVYMCSPSRSPLPPPSPPAPSRSSQCTRSKHLSHASNLGGWSKQIILDSWRLVKRIWRILQNCFPYKKEYKKFSGVVKCFLCYCPFQVLRNLAVLFKICHYNEFNSTVKLNPAQRMTLSKNKCVHTKMVSGKRANFSQDEWRCGTLLRQYSP